MGLTEDSAYSFRCSFRHEASYGLYVSLSEKASECIARFDIDNAEALIRKMKWAWCNRCFEHRLLLARFLIARNAEHDYGNALVMLRAIEGALRKLDVGNSSMAKSPYRHARNFHASVLYETAQCLYFMGDDRESLSAFKTCLEFVQSCGVRFRKLRDVERKIQSLDFMLKADGMRQVERLAKRGRYAEALTAVKRAASKCGVGHLDHWALTIFAFLHEMLGHGKTAKKLIDRDMSISDGCLETRSLYAIIHLNDRDAAKALAILSSIAKGEVESSCQISDSKMRRIVEASKFLVSEYDAHNPVCVDALRHKALGFIESPLVCRCRLHGLQRVSIGVGLRAN